MSIRLSNFDTDLISGNTHPIHLVQLEIALTAPAGAKVNWSFPGYVSIVLSNEMEIAFGESLESESGYSWNSYDVEGSSDYCNSFADLKDIKKIASKLWEQTAHLINENKGE